MTSEQGTVERRACPMLRLLHFESQNRVKLIFSVSVPLRGKASIFRSSSSGAAARTPCVDRMAFRVKAPAIVPIMEIHGLQNEDPRHQSPEKAGCLAKPCLLSGFLPAAITRWGPHSRPSTALQPQANSRWSYKRLGSDSRPWDGQALLSVTSHTELF